MNLDHKINELIKQFKPITEEETNKRIESWLNYQNFDNKKVYKPLLVQAVDKENTNTEQSDFSITIFSREEQLDDPRKMLYVQLDQLLALNRFPGDNIMQVEPTFGNSFLLTTLGIKQSITENGDIFIDRHYTKDEIKNFKIPDNLCEAGLMPKVIGFIDYCKSILPPSVRIRLWYMMSPFDLAYLIRGQDLLIDMYDDPEFVHHLIAICCDLYIRSTKILKEKVNEANPWHANFNRVLKGGQLLCEDCCILLSPELHQKFSIPYTIKALDELGGGYVHFCGNGTHLLNNYYSIPNCHGVWFGQMHLNGDAEKLAKDFNKHKKTLNYVYPCHESDLENNCQRYLKNLWSCANDIKSLNLEVDIDKNNTEVGNSILNRWKELQSHTC